MFEDPSVDFWRKFNDFIKKPRLIPTWILLCSLVFLIVGSGLVIAGLLNVPLLARAAEPEKDAEVSQVKTPVEDLRSSLDQDQESSLIKVDISGSVMNPGVYQLESTARIIDAISAAGGINPTADAIYISQKLNLSSVLSDEQKIYLPSKSERDALVSCQELLASSVEQEQEADDVEVSKLISINTASSQELEKLPGIGEKRAQDIISNRPYDNLADLLDQKIIGENTFKSIENLISI